MAKSNSQLKQEALDALDGKWGTAVLVSLIYILITFSFSGLRYILGNQPGLSFSIQLGALLVSAPLIVGLAVFSLNVIRNNELEVGQLFQGFNNYGNVLITYLLYFLILCGWIVLAVIPTFLAIVIVFAGSLFSASAPANITADTISEFAGNGKYIVYVLVILVGFFLLLIPAIIASLSYALVPFLLADEPNVGGIKVLRKSKQMMNGYKWKYFLLGLSFIGWMILSVLTLFLGYFVLLPYMYASYARFYEDRKAEFESNDPLETA